MPDELMVYCCNSDCQWTGPVSKTVHPKRQPSYWLCPQCGEVVEQAEEEGGTAGIR